MQDGELVAAIVAGDPGGLAEAYDRYAVPLYTYCRFMLADPRPPAEAADAVTDTFVIATAKLQGLRDPDQFPSWLRAVAENECLRRLGPLGSAAGAPAVAPDVPLPEVVPPDGLRKRVLETCADNTPAGRAHRVSAAHRAGPFGRTGFPKPVIPPGPRWWHEARRRPWFAAGVTALACAVVAAGIAALLLTSGPHRTPASTVALGGGSFGASSGASSAGPGEGGARSSPSGKPKPGADPSHDAASGTDGPTTSPATRGTSRSPSSAPDRSSPAASRSPSDSPSPSPSVSPSPTKGTLQVVPNELVFVAAKNKAVSGTFILTAVGGPVHFTIHSASAKVTVSPASGTLSLAGSFITITVTAKSATAVSTHVTVDPGNIVVTVKLTIQA